MSRNCEGKRAACKAMALHRDARCGSDESCVYDLNDNRGRARWEHTELCRGSMPCSEQWSSGSKQTQASRDIMLPLIWTRLVRICRQRQFEAG